MLSPYPQHDSDSLSWSYLVPTPNQYQDKVHESQYLSLDASQSIRLSGGLANYPHSNDTFSLLLVSRQHHQAITHLRPPLPRRNLYLYPCPP